MKHVHKLIWNIKFIPNDIWNMWIFYIIYIKSKHTCLITQQINENIHTHTKPKKINEHDDFNII